VALILLALSALPAAAAPNSIRWWVSTVDLNQQLAEQPSLAWQTNTTSRGECLEVNPAETFQTMLGLGSTKARP